MSLLRFILAVTQWLEEASCCLAVLVVPWWVPVAGPHPVGMPWAGVPSAALGLAVGLSRSNGRP